VPKPWRPLSEPEVGMASLAAGDVPSQGGAIRPSRGQQ